MEQRGRRRVGERPDTGKAISLALLLLGSVLTGGCASMGTPPLAGGADDEAHAAAYPVRHAPAVRGVSPDRIERTADAAAYPVRHVAAAETENAVDPTVVEPTVVDYPPPPDPLMPLNRAIFAFNDIAYRYLLIPLGRGYVRITPAPVRTSIANFFANLRTPISAVNHLFQGEPKAAGRSLLRFGVNTTIGLLGLFDPASTIGIEPEKTTFDDTLADYGAGQGVYLVLPLLGPSDTRNASGLVVDYFLHPLYYLDDNTEERVLRATDTFQQFAPTGDQYETIRAKAEDPYLFFRNLYWQGVRRDLEY